MNKIEMKNLFLIFGTAKKQALRMLKSGKSKKEIHQRTKCTIAVNNVSLSIKEGEIFVVMGLSGSGKSSLLRCFNMLNVPTSGSISIDGEDITKMNKTKLLNLRRKKVGMVFQNFGLLPHKTIIDNVAFGLEIQNINLKERYEKAKEIINIVGLSGYENEYPYQLSGGMQQRVGIARAIATDSQILLMDEAFSALDPLIRSQMQDDLLDIQQKLKKTIIFITHDLDEALKLGNTIAIMKDGVIVQQGSPEDILMNPADDYVKAFIGNVDLSKIITASTIMEPFRARVQL
ncbi:quaternary amine ABC transporter ATP-binding protein, partial [Dysgonomonas sp. UBA7698]